MSQELFGWTIKKNGKRVDSMGKKFKKNKKNYGVSVASFDKYTSNKEFVTRKNKTILPEFADLCIMDKVGLKSYLENKLTEYYSDVISGDGFVYAKGEIPVLLTAHMDTVHKETVKDFYEREEDGLHYLSSPQGIGGDDRCGVYMILQLIKTHKCSVLFCEDEEIGGIGSGKFIKTEYANDLNELKYMIELDRANSNDAVFYDCDNQDFTDWIEANSHYKEAWGSFSDIGHLAPYAKVAAVNFSCGYYKAHTTDEYVIIEEMLHTIDMVKELLECDCEQFEYIERTYSRLFGGYYGGSYGTGNWYDDYYDDYYYNRINDKPKGLGKVDETVVETEFLFLYPTESGRNIEMNEVYDGVSELENFGQLFMDYPKLSFNDVLDYQSMKF